MGKALYIIDIIGKHSGAHYYNKSFRDTLTTRYSQVKIISNYSDTLEDSAPLLYNFYEGNFFQKAIRLMISMIKYAFFILLHARNYFIFLSYGNPSEIIFAWPLIFCKKKIIDVHEVISLITRDRIQERIRIWFAKFLHNHLADAVIIHSDRSASLLSKLKFKKKQLFIPHFPYVNEREFSLSEIPDEVQSLIASDRINILFFGYVRLSKGIEEVIHLAENISTRETGEKVNIIVAGNDPGDIVRSIINDHKINNLHSLSCLLRYITDNELNYLFSETNFVLLPYLQISQSGVLEMAVHFKKPVITSSLDYFRDFLERFPSFGTFCPDLSSDAMINTVNDVVSAYKMESSSFYNEEDMKRYTEEKDPAHFLKELETLFPVTNYYS